MLVCAMVAIVCGLALVMTWRMNPNIPGLGFWIGAYSLLITAAASSLFGGTGPRLFLILSNELMIVAFVAIWQGAQRYQKQPDIPAKHWATLLYAALLGNLYFGVVDENSTIRFYITLSVMVYTSAATSYVFFIQGIQKRPASLFICSLFAIFTLFLLFGIAVFTDRQRSSTFELADNINSFVFPYTTFLVLFTIGIFLAATQRMIERFHQQADTDPLTGLYNQRAFELTGKQVLGQCARRGRNIAAILLEIDPNENKTKNTGPRLSDEALRDIAALLNASFRAQDIIAHMEAEKFCILMPETSLKAAKDIAARIRKDLSSKLITTKHTHKITGSFGISSINAATTSLATLPILLDQASSALARAQRNGGNSIELYQLNPDIALVSL